MAYTKSDLALSGYVDTAKADHDNPYYRHGTDGSELNRLENYEVVYFINHLIKKHWNGTANLATFHHIEKLIRKHPGNTRTHLGVEKWILANWSSAA